MKGDASARGRTRGQEDASLFRHQDVVLLVMWMQALRRLQCYYGLDASEDAKVRHHPGGQCPRRHRLAGWYRRELQALR